MENPSFPVSFVTSNANKLKEVQTLLQMPIGSAKLDLDELQTTDLQALLSHKVKQAYQQIQMPVMVDDTVLFFNAWKGLPGPLIKWFLDEMGVDNLVAALSPFEDKTAKAVCGLGYFDGNEFHFFSAEIDGQIVEPRGNYGFGWDCIFQPHGYSQTFAEMTPAEKSLVSMRKKALEQFKTYYDNS